MPTSTADDFSKALSVLLHDVRTPLSVAHGYLRLLGEDRLAEPEARKRAIAQSLEALGRVSQLCAEAAEFAASVSSAVASRYPVTHLLHALEHEAKAKGLRLDVLDGPTIAEVQMLAPARAASTIAVIVLACHRGPGTELGMSAGTHSEELVVTSGDSFTRQRLLSAGARETFDPWRGGHGLLLPLAVRQLEAIGVRVWTVPDEPGAVGISAPLGRTS